MNILHWGKPEKMWHLLHNIYMVGRIDHVSRGFLHVIPLVIRVWSSDAGLQLHDASLMCLSLRMVGLANKGFVISTTDGPRKDEVYWVQDTILASLN